MTYATLTATQINLLKSIYVGRATRTMGCRAWYVGYSSYAAKTADRLCKLKYAKIYAEHIMSRDELVITVLGRKTVRRLTKMQRVND